MAHWRRVLAALAEDPGSVPSSHTAAHNHLYFQFQDFYHRLQTPTGIRHKCYTQIDMGTKHSYTQNWEQDKYEDAQCGWGREKAEVYRRKCKYNKHAQREMSNYKSRDICI